VATREVVELWERLDAGELQAAVKAGFDPWWPVAPFSDDEVNALRALVHPEVYFENRVSLRRLGEDPGPVREQSGVVRTLDLHQEQLAGQIGGGHRVVYGVAGSGKTLLLLARARKLAAADPRAQVFLTCYNRTLAAWLAEQVRDCPQVTVRHFHQWAADNGVSFDPETDEAEFGEALLEALGRGSPDARRFDGVLVDEAQDFEPAWFRCLLAAMRDPEAGDLFIVADGAQGLYRRSPLNWSQLGIQPCGQAGPGRYQLDRNYRNPSEVVALAESFAAAEGLRANGHDESDALARVRIDARQCVRSTGTSPSVTLAADRGAELAHAEHLVRELLAGRWDGRPVAPRQPGEIGVLYPAATEPEKVQLALFAEKLADDGIPVAWLTQPQVYHPQDRVNSPGLKLQTIHSAKGLQYRAVVVVFADKLPRYVNRNAPGARLADRRLLYVAMTRAESFLAITASRPSEFIDEILACPAARRTGPAPSTPASQVAASA
jgi:superfamily I DNA/RNA helicase